MKCAEFAMLAEGHRRAGMLDQAEQLVRCGLDEHPDCAEGALVLALVLLDQRREEEARRVIVDWADTHLGVEVTDESASGDTFGVEVSDGEVEIAFETAETDRDEVIDADAIAQQAVSEAELDPADEFVSAESSFATRTVADLLAQQGDEQRAAQIRAMMDSTASDTAVKTRDRNDLKIERLERWLINLRGEMQ
jgi:lipopolysaccharide biosynthesis regulator YciM